MEKYAHRHNVILGITKAHYSIVKTRPSNVNCGDINVIAMGLTHPWPIQRCHHCKFMILFISSSATSKIVMLYCRLFMYESQWSCEYRNC